MPEFSSCPSEKMLIDFASQSLHADDHTAVSLHLEECQPCCEAVEWIKCHLLRPIEDDESDLTGIGLHSPGEEPVSDGHSDEPNAQMVDFDFAILEKSIVAGSIGRLGKYDLQGIIGKGGMGIVFKAWDERLHRTVAIKVLKRALASSATSRRRFLREARAAAAISHPHVVTIHSVDEHRGIPFIVMEFVNGHSLRAAVRRGSRLEFATVLRLSAQIASGLAAAHKHGVVHRDIKPGNIMLEETVDRAKITDFGLARACRDASDQTSCEMAIGTPAYMSPEQIAGEAVDYRSDLFGLGCLFYEMVAGRSPFQGKNALDVARKVDSFTPEPLHVAHPDVPRFYSDVVARLLEKEPERRFQSAEEVSELLARELHNINQAPSEQLPVIPAPAVSNAAFRLPVPTWVVAAPLAVVGLVALLVFAKDFPFLREKRAVGKEATENAPPLVFATYSSGPLVSKPTCFVSQTDPSAYASISQALNSMSVPGTVEILDDGCYEESLRINDPRWNGLTIRAPLAATLRSKSPDALLTIDSVADVTIRGLRFETHNEQHAVAILGDCPRATLSELEINVPVQSSRAAIFFSSAAAGGMDAPIEIANCSVHANACIAVVGHSHQSCQSIRIVGNRLRGHGAARDGYGVVVHANATNLELDGNRFFDLRRAISIADGEGRQVEWFRAVRNSIYRCDHWLAVRDQKLQATNVSITENFVAEVKGMELSPAALDSGWGQWIHGNTWEQPSNKADDDGLAATVAEICEHIPFLSRDPNDGRFLQLDPSK